jgi:hypothetical protein
MSHRYPTPEAFRQALEQRLRNANQRGEDLVRQRQLVVFDRFLARIDTEFGASAVLKGGLANHRGPVRSSAVLPGTGSSWRCGRTVGPDCMALVLRSTAGWRH